jgi:hypothetical protein
LHLTFYDDVNVMSHALNLKSLGFAMVANHLDGRYLLSWRVGVRLRRDGHVFWGANDRARCPRHSIVGILRSLSRGIFAARCIQLK